MAEQDQTDEEMSYHLQRWLRIKQLELDGLRGDDLAEAMNQFLNDTGLAQVPRAVEWANALRNKLENQ